MKIIEHALRAAALGVAAILPLTALAQAAAPSVGATAQPVAGDMTEAEVRKVDKNRNKITLKHGAIKNLDMPPMTMVFGVSDATLLDKAKAGDKVYFKAASD